MALVEVGCGKSCSQVPNLSNCKRPFLKYKPISNFTNSRVGLGGSVYGLCVGSSVDSLRYGFFLCGS